MFLGEQFVDELKEGSLLSIRDDSLTDYKKDDRTDGVTAAIEHLAAGGA